MGVQKRERPARGGKDQTTEVGAAAGDRKPSSENLGTKTVLKSQMRREGMEAERGRRRTNPGRGGGGGGGGGRVLRMWGRGA